MTCIRLLLGLAVGTAGCARAHEPISAKAVWLPKLWERKVSTFAAVGDRVFATQTMGQAIGSEDGGLSWHAAPGTAGSEFASDGENIFAFSGEVCPRSHRKWFRKSAAGWESLPVPEAEGHLFGTSRAVGLIGPGWVALWRYGRWDESLATWKPTPLPKNVMCTGGGPPSYAAAAGTRAFYFKAPEYKGGASARSVRATVLAADTSPWTLAPPLPLGDPIVVSAGGSWSSGLVATETDVYALVSGRLFRFPLSRATGPWLEETAPEPVNTVASAGGAVYRTLGAPARLERRDAAGKWLSWGAVSSPPYLRVLGETRGRLFVAAGGYPFWKPAADRGAAFRPIPVSIHSKVGPMLDGGDRLFFAGDVEPWSLVVESLPKDGGDWCREQLRPGGRGILQPAGGWPAAVSVPGQDDAISPKDSLVHVWEDGHWRTFPPPDGRPGSVIGIAAGKVYLATRDDVRRPKALLVYAHTLAGGGTWRPARPPLEMGANWPVGTWLVGSRICARSNDYSSWSRKTPLWCSDGDGQDWQAIPFPVSRGEEHGSLIPAGEGRFLLTKDQVWTMNSRAFVKLGPPIDLARLGVPLTYSRPLLASDGQHLYVSPSRFDGNVPIRRISLSKPDRWEAIRWQKGVKIRRIDSLSADAKRHALYLSTEAGPLRLDLP